MKVTMRTEYFQDSISQYPPLLDQFQDLLTIDLVTGILLGFFLASLAFTSLGRAAYLIFRPLQRIGRPLVRILQRLRILPRPVARTRTARGAVLGVQAAIRGTPSHMTEIEWELLQPDNQIADSADGNEAAPAESRLHDFREEERILQRKGLVFKWLSIPGAFMPVELTNPFTEEILERYLQEARRFFSQRVKLHVNAKALFEDAEGAVTISLFRMSDRRAFYALDQMRRVINSNALRLVLSLAALLATPVLVWPFLDDLGLTEPQSQVIVALLAMLVAGILMFALQNLMYANQQRQNTRELSNFLARYLDRISDRFRESSASASRVIQGDERDSKKLAVAAQKWIKILMWLPYRAFFIESFVRGVYFQIRRNSGYYLFVGVLLAILSIAGLPLVANDLELRLLIPLLAAYALLAGLYIYFLSRSVVMEELDQINWLGFDNLNVGKQMDEVIGKYAEDIGLWKGRFDR